LALNLAHVDFKRGHPDSAQQKLQEYFDAKRSDQGVAPYRLLAEILTTLSKSPDLLPRLEKLHASDANNVPLGFFLAEEYRNSERTR
jgi:hypothetical protein